LLAIAQSLEPTFKAWRQYARARREHKTEVRFCSVPTNVMCLGSIAHECVQIMTRMLARLEQAGVWVCPMTHSLFA
jgi:hypothetical protein